jgi:cell division protease FtsH
MEEAFSVEWLESHRVDVTGVTEDQIVGIGHVVAEVRSLIGRLSNPELMAEVGATLPRGVLLYGAPGIGKTWTAKWMASRISQLGDGVVFYEISADELTPDRIRDLYRHLSALDQRSVIYIDEVDLFARTRTSEIQDREGRRVLVAMLAALDGLVATPRVLTICSSNVPPLYLDAALMRPGRLGDAKVQFNAPNEAERRQLFELYAKGRAIEGTLPFERAARLSRGATPAAIRSYYDDALGLALADGRRAMTWTDLLTSLRRDGRIEQDRMEGRPEDLLRTAIHETGHIAVGVRLRGAGFIYSVHLTGRGGETKVGSDDWSVVQFSERTMNDTLALGFGGAAAEGFFYGDHTLGVKDDIESITTLLLDRIEAAMEPLFPPLSINALGRNASDGLKQLLSEAISSRAEDAQARAELIVEENAPAILAFAQMLVAAGELSGPELLDAIAASGLKGPDMPDTPVMPSLHRGSIAAPGTDWSDTVGDGSRLETAGAVSEDPDDLHGSGEASPR